LFFLTEHRKETKTDGRAMQRLKKVNVISFNSSKLEKGFFQEVVRMSWNFYSL